MVGAGTLTSPDTHMEVVYIEAVLMDNKELLHYGKSLGYVTEYQASLVEEGACKITKGGEAIVAIKCEGAPEAA